MSRLFVNNLTVIDFSYLDKHRGVVGESWIVDIELQGHLDEQGMVLDFGTVKKQIKQFIDAEIDHRLLVPIKSFGCSNSVSSQQICVEFPLSSGALISYRSPQDAVLLMDTEAIHSDHVESYLQLKIKSQLPNNVQSISIHLRTEKITDAYYQYTHGLQKHLGQCQRIAHGHRSRIEIIIDGKRSSQLEAQWAKRLQDAYIATDNHLVKKFELNGVEHSELSYTAQQGEFSISLPSEKVFFMPGESTVENIAVYLAQLISTEQQANVVVKAYEGLNKGAFGEASFS